jgi:hypothetical protein
MYHEPPGWLTFWVPIKEHDTLDSRYFFYNRDIPDSPIRSDLRAFSLNTNLLPIAVYSRAKSAFSSFQSRIIVVYWGHK